MHASFAEGVWGSFQKARKITKPGERLWDNSGIADILFLKLLLRLLLLLLLLVLPFHLPHGYRLLQRHLHPPSPARPPPKRTVTVTIANTSSSSPWSSSSSSSSSPSLSSSSWPSSSPAPSRLASPVPSSLSWSSSSSPSLIRCLQERASYLSYPDCRSAESRGARPCTFLNREGGDLVQIRASPAIWGP